MKLKDQIDIALRNPTATVYELKKLLLPMLDYEADSEAYDALTSMLMLNQLPIEPEKLEDYITTLQTKYEALLND
jgi:hypothetical protein